MNRRRAAAIFLLSSYASTALALLKGFVFVPIYLRHFDVGTYGGYLASANAIGLLGLLELGLGPVFYQRLAIAHGARDRAGFAALAGSGGVLLGAASLGVGVVGLVLAPFVPGIVNAPSAAAQPLAATFSLCALAAAANMAAVALHGLPNAWQKAGMAATTRLAAQVLEALLILIFLWRGLGVVALGLAALIAGGVCLVWSLVWVARGWREQDLPRPRVTRAGVRELVRETLPMLAARAAGQVGANLETLLISIAIDARAAAMYGITERAFRLLQSFINPVGGAVMGGLGNLVGERNLTRIAEVLREVMTLWTIIAAVTVPVLVAINRDFVGLWVGAHHYGGFALTLALAGLSVVATRAFVLYTLLVSIGGTAPAAKLSAVESSLRLPLLAAGLSWFGPAGMPALACLAYLATSLAYPAYIRGRLGQIGGGELDAGGAADPATVRALRGAGALQTTVNLSIALAAAWFLSAASDWPTLVGRALLLGGIFLAVTAASSRAARATLGALVRSARVRFV